MCNCNYGEGKILPPHQEEFDFPIRIGRAPRKFAIEAQKCEICGVSDFTPEYRSKFTKDIAWNDDKVILGQNYSRINLHAHTKYSDGSGTIMEMAKECQRVGMQACVITDHDYMLMNRDPMQDLCSVPLVSTLPVREPELGKAQYLLALDEAKRVSDELGYAR